LIINIYDNVPFTVQFNGNLCAKFITRQTCKNTSTGYTLYNNKNTKTEHLVSSTYWTCYKPTMSFVIVSWRS